MKSFTFTVALALLASKIAAAPITVVAVADFATNVLMTSGASQFALWVPTDGNGYGTSGLTCLNILSSSYGSCDIASIDQIAAVSGYTCMFMGSNGWSGSQSGTSDSGWISVAPPQTISEVACFAS